MYLILWGSGQCRIQQNFGDIGVDTFGHILEKMGSLEIPNLRKLGMLNLHPAGKMAGVENPQGGDIRIWVKLAMEKIP